MNCKDCIHYDFCNVDGYIDADECTFYKNKADFVEAVRCKDCKYYERFSIYDDDYYCMAEHTQSLFSPNKTDYCSYGERSDT